MAWTAPKTFGAERQDFADWNLHVRDNLDYLYQNFYVEVLLSQVACSAVGIGPGGSPGSNDFNVTINGGASSAWNGTHGKLSKGTIIIFQTCFVSSTASSAQIRYRWDPAGANIQIEDTICNAPRASHHFQMPPLLRNMISAGASMSQGAHVLRAIPQGATTTWDTGDLITAVLVGI